MNQKKRSQKRRRQPSVDPGSAHHRPGKHEPGSRFGDHSSWDWALPIAFIVGCIFVVFGRAVAFGFTDWDDNVNVYENPLITSQSLDGLGRIWASPHASLYVPLVYTSYLVETFLAKGLGWILVGAGAWPRGVSAGEVSQILAVGLMHTTNLALHSLCAIAVYAILRRLIGNRNAALAGALLFALHPLQAEPVAWITGRKDVLSGALSLWSLCLFNMWLVGGSLLTAGMAGMLYVLALLSKPSAMALPVLALGFGLYHHCPQKRLAGALGPAFLLAIAWGLLSQRTQSGLGESPFALDLWRRPFLAADSFCFYISKFLAPVGLAPIYPRTVASVFSADGVWLKLPVLLVVGSVVLWRKGLAALAMLWVLAPLAPVLGLVPFLFQYFSTVADRYFYVSLGGVGLLAGTLIAWVRAKRPKLYQPLLVGTAVWVALLAVLTWRQVGFWSGPESLWARELVIHPKCTHALYNLASREAERGALNEAVRGYRQILEIDPAYASAYTNLMVVLRKMGALTEAKEVAAHALTLKPGSADNYIALGNAHIELGNFGAAADAFRAAIKGDPNDPDAHNNLGIALLQLQDEAGAEDAFRVATRLNERFASPRANLGIVLARRGRLPEAAEQLRIALDLDPGDTKSRARLAVIETRISGGATPPD